MPPLTADRLKELDKRKNVFFRHSDAEFFLAERDGRLVGTIAAIENRRHLETHGDGTGFFGFFECVADTAVAAALVEAAADWLRSRGLEFMRGPINFNMNDPTGVLLNAYDLAPVVMMAYNPPYYAELLEKNGFEKCHDLYAYRAANDRPPPDRLKRAYDRLLRKGRFRIRHLEMSRFQEEVALLFAVHAEAWEENWGEVPVTEEEVRLIASALKVFIDPELIHVVLEGHKAVALSVALPDANQALIRARGRRFPLGLLKILRARKRIDTVREILMGVLKPYRGLGIDAALTYKTWQTGLEKGYRWREMSWVLESNEAMWRSLEMVGAERYKTYRLYQKVLGG